MDKNDNFLKFVATPTTLMFYLLLSLEVFAEPSVRPDNWAKPIINTSLENLHVVDEGIYRSSQPKIEDINDLKKLGIKEILNLRYFHNNNGKIKKANFDLHSVPMNTFNVSEQDIIEALKIIKNRKDPLLVHCWHGSDRTGITIAAYRIIFNDWSKQQALAEMNQGGFGYHSELFPNLVSLVNQLDVKRIRQELGIAH